MSLVLNWRHCLYGGLLVVAVYAVLIIPTLPSGVTEPSGSEAPQWSDLSLGTNSDAVNFEGVRERLNKLAPEKKAEDEEQQQSAKDSELDAQKSKPKVLRPNHEHFDENTQVALVGVFSAKKNKQFAVLRMEEFDSGQSQFVKVKQGDALGPYLLTELGQKQVTLSHQNTDKVIRLDIFKIGSKE
ncbi:hypothetical protein HMF8227_00717 [Saliniradius amylolyticus]|uniref:Uncharacterized protein n=1 Tax=Saliniradius amylolyticus TaxID=2183582 RepID=A0A2S2E0R8_9ALTE|nr:hypothetical protein [Saliniradius amylolyticus]AWL11213.1 hypothetical protein HMF8227_00717 [Saliniradius amylolyticus]